MTTPPIRIIVFKCICLRCNNGQIIKWVAETFRKNVHVDELVNLPDITYLIINWKIGYSDIDLLMNVLVVLMQIENNTLSNIFKNFKD